MAITDKPEELIEVFSIVSRTTGEGVVEFRWGDKRAQLSPEEAREHALGIVECAEAAETDAFMVEFFEKELGIGHDEALRVLIKFRSFRDQRVRKKMS